MDCHDGSSSVGVVTNSAPLSPNPLIGASSPSVPINCNGAQQSTVDTGMTDGIGSGGSFGMTSESMMVNPDHDDVMFNLGGQEDISDGHFSV